MWEDEILEELHRIREEHAKLFNYDLDAMFADWQQKQAASGREIVTLSHLSAAQQIVGAERTRAIC